MNSLFDGLDQLSDDEIKGQIALLKCVTFSNTIRERSQKAVKFLVDTAGELFGRSQSTDSSEQEIQLTNIRKMIDTVYNDLDGCSRAELNEELKEVLITKVESLSSVRIDRDVEETLLRDILHILIIREAARVYMVDEMRSLGQQADMIHDKYYEHYLNVLRKKIDQMSLDEKQKLEMRIQVAITKGNLAQMRHLANELMLREFNGKTLVTKLQVTQGITVVKKLIDAMGMNVFDGIDTAIETAYDSMMMFCRLERALLAEVVWTAMNGFGKEMTLKQDLMPSYSAEFREEEKEKERKILVLMTRERQLNQVLKNLLADIDRHNKSLVIREENFNRSKEQLVKLQEEFKAMLEENETLMLDSERIKKEYESYVDAGNVNSSDPEYRRRKQEYENLARAVRNFDSKVTSSERSIMRQSADVEKQRIQVAELNKKLETLREELIANVTEFNKLIMELENEAGYRSQVLNRKWKSFFVTWEFDKNVFYSVAKNFTRREIVELERMLAEMDFSSAKNEFAVKGKGTEEQIVYCMVGPSKYAQIIYHNNLLKDVKVKDRN